MTKEELRVEVIRREQQLQKKQEESRQLDDKYQTLISFSRQCEKHANDFDTYISRRKQRLSALDGLCQMVRSAAGYQREMKTVLTGAEYKDMSAAIQELLDSVAKEISKVRGQANECDNAISRLKEELRQLRYEYDSLVKEAAEDGT